MSKQYLLREMTTIASYDNKEEAEADKSNFDLWYPENSHEVVEQELE